MIYLSARLLGKLAIDVADNYKELANLTEKKLLNQIRRKHFLHGGMQAQINLVNLVCAYLLSLF